MPSPSTGWGSNSRSTISYLRQGFLWWENLTNLDRIGEEFTFICLPLKIRDADGRTGPGDRLDRLMCDLMRD